MVLECATYLTLEFPSTENQHTPLWVFVFVFCHWFVFFFLIFHPKLCSFLFMRLGAVKEVLAFLHCVGKLGHGVGQNILDYFFLAAGMKEEHIGPWMVSQLMGVSCLPELLSSSPTTSLVCRNISFSHSLHNSPNQGRGPYPGTDVKSLTLLLK